MKRRTFLAAAGSVAVAGCAGGSGSPVHTVARTVARKKTTVRLTSQPKTSEGGGGKQSSTSRQTTEKNKKTATQTTESTPPGRNVTTLPRMGNQSGNGTGATNGTASTTAGGSKQSISRSQFATQLSTRARHNGFTGNSQVGFSGNLAYTVYSESAINRGTNLGPWRDAYTSLVDQRNVKWNLEGRVKHTVTGGHWYTYQIKKKWAKAYLAGTLSQGQYKSKIQNSEKPWK